jgi:hypothetical protein
MLVKRYVLLFEICGHDSGQIDLRSSPEIGLDLSVIAIGTELCTAWKTMDLLLRF